MYNIGFYGGKFMPFHKGHLHCILRAASQCNKLYVVIMYNGKEELEILKTETKFGNKNLTPHIRELAIRKELKSFPNIEIIMYNTQSADDRAIQEGKDLWYYECQDMVNLMGQFDACYSSEPEYHKLFQHYYSWAESIILDGARATVPISGSQLRNMTVKDAYQYLPRSYQQLVNKKVLFVGTCSCGKTTTIQKLAKYYNTSYSEEQGRLVSESYNIHSPGSEYYNQFVCQQYMANVKAVEDANLVALLDTDALITRFYNDLYEDSPLPAAEAIAADNQYDLVLFFEPTVPFVHDGMRTKREEARRWELSQKLKETFLQYYDIKVLSGTYEENYLNAIKYIDEMLGE